MRWTEFVHELFQVQLCFLTIVLKEKIVTYNSGNKNALSF